MLFLPFRNVIIELFSMSVGKFVKNFHNDAIVFYAVVSCDYLGVTVQQMRSRM
jgi:hypothetical protein